MQWLSNRNWGELYACHLRQRRVCVCVCEYEREREREKKNKSKLKRTLSEIPKINEGG